MTRLFFVRHAQPQHSWKDDRTRPLTEEGMQDTARVLEFFRNVPPDAVYSSPYRRSVDTIKSAAEYWQKEIHTDERLRERESGTVGSSGREMIQKRWADFDYHEPGGESIGMAQERNIAAVMEILEQNPGKNRDDRDPWDCLEQYPQLSGAGFWVRGFLSDHRLDALHSGIGF